MSKEQALKFSGLAVKSTDVASVTKTSSLSTTTRRPTAKAVVGTGTGIDSNLVATAVAAAASLSSMTAPSVIKFSCKSSRFFYINHEKICFSVCLLMTEEHGNGFNNVNEAKYLLAV